MSIGVRATEDSGQGGEEAEEKEEEEDWGRAGSAV
jgi:hypothetical protein